MIKKIIYSYIFYITSAFGISLTLKAGIGVSSFNALNLSIANASTIKVGSITIIFNILFLIIYIALSHFKHKKKYIIQIISVLFFGNLINFFTYYALKDLQVTAYLLQIILMITGTIIGGLSVGMIISFDAITFPIEATCLQLSKISKLSFLHFRYSVDILSVIISISVSLSYSLPLYVREGTIISLLLLTASINTTKNFYKKKSLA